MEDLRFADWRSRFEPIRKNRTEIRCSRCVTPIHSSASLRDLIEAFGAPLCDACQKASANDSR